MTLGSWRCAVAKRPLSGKSRWLSNDRLGSNAAVPVSFRDRPSERQQQPSRLNGRRGCHLAQGSVARAAERVCDDGELVARKAKYARHQFGRADEACGLTAIAGMPSFSAVMESCRLHDEQLPQSPMPVTTACQRAISSTMSRSAEEALGPSLPFEMNPTVLPTSESRCGAV
jgi:hypothetical protein